MKNLFEFFWPREARRSPRLTAPLLVTYYWDGERATAGPHCIRNISANGFYLLTERRWYLGTLLRVTMQLTEDAAADVIILMAKVIRSGADGVGFEFIFTAPGDEQLIWGLDALKLTDKKTLKQFLRRSNGHS